MKKQAISIFAVLVVLALFTGTAMAQGGIPNRIHDQQKRITLGVRNGSLTPGEAGILQDNLNHVRGSFERAKADGVLTRSELYRLNKMLDRNSHMIRKYKGNRAVRIY